MKHFNNFINFNKINAFLIKCRSKINQKVRFSPISLFFVCKIGLNCFFEDIFVDISVCQEEHYHILSVREFFDINSGLV